VAPKGQAKHAGGFTDFQTKVNKKVAKIALFSATNFPIEIRTISPIILLKCADFLALWGMWVLGIEK